MKILHSADWHILLHKKKVPQDWQANRFKLFFDKILELEQECDIHILAGDVFDTAPKLDESTLFEDYANRVTKRTIIIPGNHEATKKGKTFLSNYVNNPNSISNPLVEIYTENTRIEHQGQGFQLFPYGEMQINNLPKYVEDDILVTHIRGEVPPHITPEYDFKKLRPWKLILLGDLHFNHKYQDYPAYYPGSPMNVSFDRDASRKYGVNIIDFKNIDNYKVNFLPLDLPKLVRKTINAGEQETMKKDDFHHVIYEVTGSVDELGTVDIKNELVDKKIAHRPTEDSALNLTEMESIADELKAWLVYSKVENVQGVMDTYNELGVRE